MSFIIATDTSANLPTAYLKQNSIAVMPFHYLYDGEDHTCMDTKSFDGAAYYKMIQEGKEVNTSQVNPQTYIDCFKPYLEEGKDILFVGMSSGISSSFASAQTAKVELDEEFPDRKIMLIDTHGASLGEGIPVMKAVELKEQGMEIETVYSEITEMCKRMYQIFMVDDLMHLSRTGRLHGAVAVVGTMLKIKALLKGNEKGQIVSIGKAHGRKKAIEAIAKKYDNLVRNASSQTVGIAHADCMDEVKYLIELLNRNNPPKEIMTVMYEPVTGAHVGPGTIALFFESDDTCRSK